MIEWSRRKNNNSNETTTECEWRTSNKWKKTVVMYESRQKKNYLSLSHSRARSQISTWIWIWMKFVAVVVVLDSFILHLCLHQFLFKEKIDFFFRSFIQFQYFYGIQLFTKQHTHATRSKGSYMMAGIAHLYRYVVVVHEIRRLILIFASPHL